MGEVRERYGGLRGPRRMVGLPRHWLWLSSSICPLSLQLPLPALPPLRGLWISLDSALLLPCPGSSPRVPTANPSAAVPIHPRNHVHPPAERSLANGVAVKMHSVTLLILSSGHFTGFLGQIFSPSKLFLKSKWQPWGKKAK